jgi:hypothetical protein
MSGYDDQHLLDFFFRRRKRASGKRSPSSEMLPARIVMREDVKTERPIVWNAGIDEIACSARNKNERRDKSVASTIVIQPMLVSLDRQGMEVMGVYVSTMVDRSNGRTATGCDCF